MKPRFPKRMQRLRPQQLPLLPVQARHEPSVAMHAVYVRAELDRAGIAYDAVTRHPLTARRLREAGAAFERGNFRAAIAIARRIVDYRRALR